MVKKEEEIETKWKCNQKKKHAALVSVIFNTIEKSLILIL